MTEEVFRKIMKDLDHQSMKSLPFKIYRLQLSLLILFATGCRISELVNLKLGDITTLWAKTGYIYIARLKKRGSGKK